MHQVPILRGHMTLSSFQVRILAVLVGLLVLVVDLQIPLGVAAGVPYIAVVMIGLWLPGQRDVIVIAVLSSIATIIGYLYSSDAGISWMVISNRVLALAAIWACAVVVLLLKKTLLELEEAKKQAEQLLEISEAIVIELDTDLCIKSINELGCRVLGYSASELQGRSWASVSVSADKRKAVNERWLAATSGKSPMPARNESELLCRSGEKKFIIWRNHVLRDNDGKITGILSSGQDVTSLKKAESELRQMNFSLESRVAERARELRMITDQLPVQISRFDTAERYVFVNRTSADRLGTTTDLAENKTIEEVVGSGIYPHLRDRIARSISGEPQDFEETLVYPDGTQREVRVQYLPDFDSQGNVTAVIGLVIDMTESRKTERSLSRSENRYKTIFESGNVAIIRTDPITGKAIEANDREAEILGYKNRADLLENYEAHKHWYSMEDREKWLASKKAGEVSWDAELRMITRQGNSVWLHTSSVFNQSENTVDIISVDITKSKEQEKTVLTAREEAEYANRAKSEFLANMSHELRTPLNAILGFSQIIRDKVFGADDIARYAEYAGDIYESGDHLLAIINDVLDLSRIEAGKSNLRYEAIETERLVTNCVKLVSGRIRESRQTISMELPPMENTLHADKRMLKQMLLNLLSNANKFTPTSGHISIYAGESDAGLFELTVTDNGIGIAEEDLPRIMQPFGQVEDTFTRQFDGSGLGLPLVASLAELHQGGLKIKSEPGKGTTITIWLPFHPSM